MHFEKHENLFKCDRTTPLGNKYHINKKAEDKNGERSRVINLFEKDLREQIYSKTNIPLIKYLVKIYKVALKEEVALGCWCSPRSCHCDSIRNVLWEILNPRIIICGGRTFNNHNILINVMSKLKNNHLDLTIIQGDNAKGADRMAKQYCLDNDIKVESYPARWKDIEGKPDKLIKTNRNGEKYYVLAGMDRNTLMLERAYRTIAFWDGKSSGTLDMINKTKKSKKSVDIIHY